MASNRRPGKRTAQKHTGISASSPRDAAGKATKIEKRNEKRRARNADNSGQGEAGGQHIDSPAEKDRGPIGTKGKSAPGQSMPGRR